MNEYKQVIEIFKMENELMEFNPSTGEEEPIELQNEDNQDLYKANLVAIEVLETQINNGWVSVSERLPKREGSYLVSVERTLCNRLEHMTETVLYNGDGYWHLFSGRVIAWQPLPEPYKEENHD